jgi:hypothetical protein
MLFIVCSQKKGVTMDWWFLGITIAGLFSLMMFVFGIAGLRTTFFYIGGKQAEDTLIIGLWFLAISLLILSEPTFHYIYIGPVIVPMIAICYYFLAIAAIGSFIFIAVCFILIFLALTGTDVKQLLRESWKESRK